MAISFPTDTLDAFPGWSTEFSLLWRQEQSRTAGGQTYVKDFGSPLWSATYQSKSLKPNELDYWRAKLDVLENGLNQFVGRPSSRCYPIAYPKAVYDANFPSFAAAQIDVINANRKAISLKALPAGYTVSVGDIITIGSGAQFNMHRVVEAATSGGTGITPQFEIRPHLWPMTAVNNSVVMAEPFCIMTLVPGSISSTAELSTGRGVITFQAVESR